MAPPTLPTTLPSSALKPARTTTLAKILVLTAAVFTILGYLPATLALATGIVLALLGLAAFSAQTKKLSKLLIQASIVLLGLSIPLQDVIRAGPMALGLAAAAITLIFLILFPLARLFKVDSISAALLGAGTAICGGSAIAATSGILRATASQTAVATAVIFLLNAGAMYAYPPIGRALQMTDAQFGAWAAIGVHDVAGVVAAAKAFSPEAADQATIIKLTRVLFIVPVALLMAWAVRRMASAANPLTADRAQTVGQTAPAKDSSIPIPWYIGLFLVACAIRSLLPAMAEPISATGLPGSPAVRETLAAGSLPRWAISETLTTLASAKLSIADVARTLGRTMLALALLCIGLGLSREALRQVGTGALALGVVLWLTVSICALLAVRFLI